MMILALESSATACSVVLTRDGSMLAQAFQHSGLTHSRTLLPMAEDLLKNAELSIKDVEGFAVAQGPGSFTGLRIGIAAVKALGMSLNKPCAAVSTLEALAYNMQSFSGIICAAMDARCNQVYTAFFESDGTSVKRLCEDRAIAIEDLREELKAFDSVVIAGDGARLCAENIELENCRLANEEQIYQNAAAVSRAAENKKRIPPRELMPVYLRPSQAERELKLKKEK